MTFLIICESLMTIQIVVRKT